MEYNKFSVKGLKSILEKKGLKGVSKYKKDELINTLLKLEAIENEENETQEVDIQIPLPPPLVSSAEEVKLEEVQNDQKPEELNEENKDETVENKDETVENKEELTEEDNAGIEIAVEKELEKEEPQNEESNDIKPNERIMDPVRLFEQFKPSLNVAENKKSDILKGMIQYKTAQKLMERQEIQREIDKVAIELKVMRQEYLGMIDIVRKDLKEVRESFLMAMLIILHNFSFIPLDKLPIFKNQKK
jgi:hypothetical protein